MEVAGSGGTAIASTLTTGIQDISALLPLLGTEQCEEHLASSLTNGYLYAAATPLSIFGSLGAARTGFKTFLSSISILRLKFSGARILADAGFKPQGTNLSLVMLDEDRKSYRAEERLQSLMKELHLDDSNKISLSSKTRTWNTLMFLVTAVCSLVSITPYIHLNLHEPNSLTPFVRWTFPIIKAIGGFLTATMTQLVIQNRILEITRKRLILNSLSKKELECLDIKEENSRSTALDQRFSVLEWQVRLKVADLEKDASKKIQFERLKSIRGRIVEANGSPIVMWIFLILLFIGIVASVAGYIGCFSAVQGVRSSQEALYWLCLEAGLSVIRIILWGLNPEGDDAPPLELKLKLDKHSPLPTCTSYANDIETEMVLPLVRATEFLEAITSYAGLVKRFSDPSLTLYYTLTRRHDDDPQLILRQRVLYITVFHHTERTTRVLIRNSECEPQFTFYSADPVTVDLERVILMTKIGHPIQHEDDPIAGDVVLREALQEHYHSILDQIDSTPGTGRPKDSLKNVWTLKLGDSKSETQKSGGLDQQENVVTNNGEKEESDRTRDRRYLEQNRTIQHLYDARGQWITDYMEWSRQETDNDLSELKEVYGIVMGHYEQEMVEKMLIVERSVMEMILVDEIYGWERQLRKFLENLVELHKLDAVLRAQLQGRWRTESRERLEKGRSAMEARVHEHEAETKLLGWVADGKENNLLDEQLRRNSAIRVTWKRVLESAPPGPSSSPSRGMSSSERLENATMIPPSASKEYGTLRKNLGPDGLRRCEQGEQKMKGRLRREVQGVEERLRYEVGEFQNSQQLIKLTLWQRSEPNLNSKWAGFDARSNDPAAIVSALERRQNVALVYFDIYDEYQDDDVARIFAATGRMMSCTSIFYKGKIPDSVQLPPNILSVRSFVELSKAHMDALKQNHLQNQKTTIEIYGVPHMGSVISIIDSFTLRFFGPDIDYLTLRLFHRASAPMNYFTVNGFKCPIPRSNTLVVEEFKIWNRTLQKSSKLTFTPGFRNTLDFSPTNYGGYYLRDIELLDEKRLPYDPADGGNKENARPPPHGEVECVGGKLEHDGLEPFAEFENSQQLANTKWARFDAQSGDPAAIVSALENLQNVALVYFDIYDEYQDDDVARIFAATGRIMSCTSIFYKGKIPDSVQLPPNILSIRSLVKLSEAHQGALKQNHLQSQRTTIEIHGVPQKGSVISLIDSFTLRFFGPDIDYLTLRLVHRASAPMNYFAVNGFKCPIPHSDTLVVEEFTIWNRTLQKSCKLTFTPGFRNILDFSPTNWGDYYLRDIELLDQERLPYDPADGRNEREDPRPPLQPRLDT